MLLHSGSGLHRHEYSSPISPKLSRATLARSAFSSPVIRPLPVRHDSSIDLKTSLRPETSTTEIRRNTVSVSFVRQEDTMEEQVAYTSDDEKSVISHEGSEETFNNDRRSHKKKKTTKTSYAIAHPAPTMRQKHEFMALRPQLLLQLQRVSAAKRPMPIIDVLPSAVFVPRLAKKFPIVFKVLGGLGLGPNDILCVKSEDYGASDHSGSGSDSDDEGWASRDVEAVICQAKKSEASRAGQVEIVFSSGSKWTAIPISASIYEFTSIDEHGLKTTARWVRRTFQRSTSDMREKAPTTPKKDTKFNFSILDPNTRRHPVIASLTSNCLDIPDTYTLLSPSHQKKNSIDTETVALTETEHTREEPSEKSIVTVSESVRKLIQITSVWVTLRQGWSPNFKYDDSPCDVRTPHQNTPTSNASSFCRGRSVSLDHKTRHHNAEFANTRTGAETPESAQGSFSSASGFSRKLKRKSTSKCPLGNDSTNDSHGGKIVDPRRSTSTGAAFMAKIAARRAGHNTPHGPPSTVASDSDGESLNQSPPRRAATMAVTAGASRSSLSVNDGGRLRKRVSSPSPLVAIYSQGNSDWEGEDDVVLAVAADSTRPTASTQQPSNSARLLATANDNDGTMSPTSPTAPSKSSSTTRKVRKSRKRSTWGKFTALFRKKG